MTTFVQLHLLTEYGPSNPNRDDQGRPKQANVGGAPRLRLSSQSVKRAIRESTFFELDLKDHQGTRTKRLYGEILRQLLDLGIEQIIAEEKSKAVAEVFGKLKKDEKIKEGLKAETLAFFSPAELAAAVELAVRLAGGEKMPKNPLEAFLQLADGAVDVAMFGRMFAGSAKEFNRDAAVQVAHAITTHQAVSEDDWFSAVDDLNKAEDSGAGHLGESGFGSGIYYQYICVNVDLLIENLKGDRELAAKGIEALVRAAATATPTGKQNSFAHRPRAYYIRAEKGSQQPRDLTGAFFAPVKAQPWEETSVKALEDAVEKIDRAYGTAYSAQETMNVPAGEGTLDGIAAFAGAAAAE
jgi:CRISPR system Cascade subunit CasC